jgi:replicative DNA helicase
MTEISRELEALAHDLDIPLVAAAQLNRGVESRQDKRPQLSDLRDSGSLEADAGTVQFIYRDDYYNPHTDRPCIAELLTPKNRYGPTGTVQLYFNNTLAKFGNLAVKEIAL